MAIKKYQGRKADVTSFSTPKGKKKSVSPSKATGLRLSASDNDDLTSDDEVVLTSAKKKALSSHANRVSSNTDYEEEVEEEAWPETQGLSSRNELFDALDADAYRYVLSRLDVDSATDSTDVLRNTFESSNSLFAVLILLRLILFLMKVLSMARAMKALTCMKPLSLESNAVVFYFWVTRSANWSLDLTRRWKAIWNKRNTRLIWIYWRS